MTYLKGIFGNIRHMFGDKIQKKENLPYRWLSHWKWATMVAKIRPLPVTLVGWCCARLTRRFLKACAIARFRNQFARGQKTIGSHLKLNICMPFVIISIVKSLLIYLFHWYLSYIITVPTVYHPTKLQYPHFELIFGDFAPAIIGCFF